MNRVMITGIVCCMVLQLQAQPVLPGKKRRYAADTFRVISSGDYWQHDLPIAALQENIKSEDAIGYVPSLLGANRDLLISTASFHFNIVRFRQRGYDAEWSATLVNGIPMNNPEDGNTPWAFWSGLNDVTRNTQITQGLRAGDMHFGSIGNTVAVDMRAFRQREQTQAGYSFSNRSYTHRWMFSHSSGFNNKGWSYSASGSIRYAAEGYVPGTFYRGGSYFIGLDKKINDNNILSFVFFGSSVYNGRQSPVLQETADLLKTHSYNSYWGYQDGRKRNANTGKTHVPVLILNLDKRFSNRSSLLVSVAGIAGRKSSTALDWYNAADPRPDYYRYLPSYQKDSVLYGQVLRSYLETPALQQVDWDKLYTINKNSYSVVHDADGIPGNTMGGLRSHYIIEERITDIRRCVLNTVYTGTISEGISLVAGAAAQWQQLHYYKKIDDLLGGEYYVDWNQFAEGDVKVLQNDLNRPNRVLHRGDAYGYNYRMLTGTAAAWMQVSSTGKKADVFISGRFQYTCYQRDGLVRTGLFPDHSFGRSRLHEFADYAVKAGITYKISGRKYFYLNALVLTRAPYPDNVFISPRTRDTEQENIVPEKAASVETGYVWNAPTIKLRLTGYLAKFTDGMNVLTFYHDMYRSFVNYALNGIDKLHSGMEMGAEIRLSPRYTLQLAAAAGRYLYSSRQEVAVSADNDAYITERGLIYTKNFRVAGTPQEAYSIGLAYQSPGGFYANITAAYFRQQWLEYNPVRRTYTALQDIPYGSDNWIKTVQQTLLPDQYTVDVSGGISFNTKLGGEKKRTIVLFASINNLLNKQDIFSGGYEQLRFDADDVGKFPPKLFYAMGLNFSVNCTLRL